MYKPAYMLIVYAVFIHMIPRISRSPDYQAAGPSKKSGQEDEALLVQVYSKL